MQFYKKRSYNYNTPAQDVPKEIEFPQGEFGVRMQRSLKQKRASNMVVKKTIFKAKACKPYVCLVFLFYSGSYDGS